MVEVHGGTLFWSVITFMLLLIVLKKVAWGPIISSLESREKIIGPQATFLNTTNNNRNVITDQNNVPPCTSTITYS